MQFLASEITPKRGFVWAAGAAGGGQQTDFARLRMTGQRGILQLY